MSLPIVQRRGGTHATPAAVDRMVRKRSHAGMINKRQRASDDDETTRRTTTRAAATTRATADATTTRARATTPAAAPTSAAPPTSARAVATSVRATSAPVASAPVAAGSRAVSGASSGVAGPASATPSAGTEEKSSTNTGMIVGVVVVAIACLAALAAFVVLRRKKRAKAAAMASRAEKSKSEEMFGDGPGDMTAVDSYRNRMNNDYGPGAMGGAGAGKFSQSPYSPNMDKGRRSWEMSDDGRSYGNHSEVGLVGAAAYPGKGRHPSSNPSEQTFGSEGPYSPNAPPVPAIDPALAAIQAVGVNQNGPNGKAGDGQIYVVKRMFEPSLSDELIIYPGDRVRIITMYDDGWCLTENLTSAAPNAAPPRGVCPRDCIDNAPLSEAELASSPISAAGGANRISMPMPHPNLPSLQIDPNHRGAPQIEVSSPDGSRGGPYGGVKEGKPRALTPTQGQGQPKSPTTAGQPKRHSSLIASRDAELFVALGEVLEKDGQRK